MTATQFILYVPIKTSFFWQQDFSFQHSTKRCRYTYKMVCLRSQNAVLGTVVSPFLFNLPEFFSNAPYKNARFHREKSIKFVVFLSSDSDQSPIRLPSDSCFRNRFRKLRGTLFQNTYYSRRYSYLCKWKQAFFCPRLVAALQMKTKYSEFFSENRKFQWPSRHFNI